jgi:DNA-binding response OmpR family regulator
MNIAEPTITVLIVSNHERLAAVLQREIRSHGHLATITKNAREALETAGAMPHDLVLLDSHLDGEKASSIAGKLTAIRPVAVVMLAGTEKEIAEHRESGAEICGYLLKPFDTPQFWTAIRNALKAVGTPGEEVCEIAEAYNHRALEDAMSKAAQMLMKRWRCNVAEAYERIAEVAAARAENLRKGASQAA